MLRRLWAIFTFSVYLSAISWLIVSKMIERLFKKTYSFTVDMVVFACLFVIAVVLVTTWIF